MNHSESEFYGAIKRVATPGLIFFVFHFTSRCSSAVSWLLFSLFYFARVVVALENLVVYTYCRDRRHSKQLRHSSPARPPPPPSPSPSHFKFRDLPYHLGHHTRLERVLNRFISIQWIFIFGCFTGTCCVSIGCMAEL